MITLHSIDLKYCGDPCASLSTMGGNKTCSALTVTSPECNYKCPFYKPEGCADWIRVEDHQGINIVPQEEYCESRTIKEIQEDSWRIISSSRC